MRILPRPFPGLADHVPVLSLSWVFHHDSYDSNWQHRQFLPFEGVRMLGNGLRNRLDEGEEVRATVAAPRR